MASAVAMTAIIVLEKKIQESAASVRSSSSYGFRVRRRKNHGRRCLKVKGNVRRARVDTDHSGVSSTPEERLRERNVKSLSLKLRGAGGELSLYARFDPICT